MQRFLNAKVKSCASIALLSMLLLLPTVPFSSGQASGTWLIYDRNDPDYGHSGTDPLAVRFTPPRIWLGMGKTCTLFKITAIRLYLYCDSQSAGFDVYVTDQDHQVIKSFLNRDPEVNGWYDLDLTGWTDDSRYVETHFFVEFDAHAASPNLQESWPILWFDEAVIDEGEASYGRSYRYTYGPENPNPSIPAWLPIELTYPYGSGDLMIRVELEPQMPETVLPSLIEAISAADDIVFKGQAPSVKATLIKKINEAISMFEKGNYGAGLNKLENDIASKLADPRPTPLADPRPTPRTSWLQLYQEGSENQKLVTSFAVTCQNIVQLAQKSALPPGVPERCDFNNDGYDDLAIGVPNENIGGKDDAGAVNVLYGSASGISAVGDDYWHQDVSGVKGDCDAYDRFGDALAIGDFNGDEFDDLAIGVPGEKVDDIESAGAVNVLYGSANGLTEDGDQLWSQNSDGVEGVCEEDDYFGSTLAAGDFNGDGYDDLAVGVFSEDIGDIGDAGAVNVLYGSSSGLSATGDQVWSQDSIGIGGVCEVADCFGAALTVGDFNGDGFEDLAIGVPNEEINGKGSAGAVNMLYGSDTGLAAIGSQVWYQDSVGILDESEWNDHFGAALAAGDFNGDGYDDLAVGVPKEDISWVNEEIEDAGVVAIIVGSSIGLSAANDQIIDQGLWAGECEEGDHFGASLAAGDFNQDGFEDLAVGAPFDDYYEWVWETTYEDAGYLSHIYGCSLGLKWSTHSEIWYQFSSLGEGVWENKYFAKTLSAGDFNGDGYFDLAIGVPGETVYVLIRHAWHPKHDAGMVGVVYGFPDDGLLLTGCQTWHQSVSGVEGTCDDFDYFGSSLPGSFYIGV